MVATATNSLEDALRSLERAEVEKQRELEEIRVSKASLQRLIGVVPASQATVSLEYAGLGPVEAAERLFKELGKKSLTTREIVDGMVERGWTTRSRNAVATVYATLTNARKKFERNKEAQWELKSK